MVYNQTRQRVIRVWPQRNWTAFRNDITLSGLPMHNVKNRLNIYLYEVYARLHNAISLNFWMMWCDVFYVEIFAFFVHVFLSYSLIDQSRFTIHLGVDLFIVLNQIIRVDIYLNNLIVRMKDPGKHAWCFVRQSDGGEHHLCFNVHLV